MRRLLKRFTSINTRRKLAFTIVRARMPSAPWRPLPNLLIIGAQRCGTSSLFKYLGAHPDCDPSIRKEIRYFTEYYNRGVSWYRAHFPFHLTGQQSRIFFEATPDYLLDPRIPRRVISLLPTVRIIALLRDPVERAYSHYWHNRRLGTEYLSFEQAIATEEERITPALRAIERDESLATPRELLRYSYVERGRYAKHLEPWLKMIEKDRVLILSSESLYKNTDEVYQSILTFLGLPGWRPPAYENYSYEAERPVIPPMGAKAKELIEAKLASDRNWLSRLDELNVYTSSKLKSTQS